MAFQSFKINIMKEFLLLLFVLAGLTVKSQLTFFIDDDISYPDFRVRIGEDVSYPDIRIRIGSDVSFEDFTVGVTSNKSQAQFIVSESRYSDYTVRAGEDVSYPDLSIKAGADVSYPDITIEIRSSGIVDYVVYTEKDFITLRDIVIALLPAINTETGFKFDELKEVFKE